MDESPKIRLQYNYIKVLKEFFVLIIRKNNMQIMRFLY